MNKNNNIIFGLIYLGDVYIKFGNKTDSHIDKFGFIASKKGKNFRCNLNDKTCYWWDLNSITQDDIIKAENKIYIKTGYRILYHKDALKNWDKIHKIKDDDIINQEKINVESFKKFFLNSLITTSFLMPPSFGNNLNMTRGFRNNNPGNIEVSNIKWKGMIGNDGRFIIFDSMENGVRAIAKILKTYYTKYDINTIEKIINRWAPPNENNTKKYIEFVSKRTNIPKDRYIDLLNDTTSLYKIIEAIIYFENGKSLDKKIIEAGILKSNES